VRGRAALAGCLVVALVGCSQERPRSKAANTEAGARTINVTVGQVVGQDVERTVQMVGTLLPAEEVTLGTEVAATVRMIFVDFGDPVRAGQVVIKLDDRSARLDIERTSASLKAAQESLSRAIKVLESSRANVDRAKAVLADAAVNRKRLEGLFSEGAISASARDSARTQHEVSLASLRVAEAQYESDQASVKAAEASAEQAQAALAVSQKALQDTEVVSPIDGFVRKRLVNVGDTFKEKTPLLSIVATQTLRLQGEVPERFASQVALGRAVRMEVEAYPGQMFPCTITRINPSVDSENRSFLVEASVPNPKGLLKPGFFAKAVIVTGMDRNVPFVPEEAVVSLAGNVKVYVIEGNKAEEHRVRTGIRRDGLVEILEGVKIGQIVATSNLTQLATGTSVTVQTGSRSDGPGEKPANAGGPRKGPKG
jgi:multidrug efflux pump subunit AcrA (membrane-fusion protein)